jgi:putative hemolysin
MLKLTALPLAYLALSACSATEVPEQRVGMANPASVYCANQGGRVEVRDEKDGQVGYCHLPDGRVVEEWALFRASQKPE